MGKRRSPDLLKYIEESCLQRRRIINNNINALLSKQSQTLTDQNTFDQVDDKVNEECPPHF